MTVQEIQEMVSEQLGRPVTNLRTSAGRVGEVSGDFFNRNEYSYSGLATTVERSVDIEWTFKKFDDGWYFSSDPV